MCKGPEARVSLRHVRTGGDRFAGVEGNGRGESEGRGGWRGGRGPGHPGPVDGGELGLYLQCSGDCRES